MGVAKAAENRANAEVSLTKLDVAALVGQAFLAVAAAQLQVRAAQADVDRRQVLANSIHVLVNQELRPGADASRAVLADHFPKRLSRSKDLPAGAR